ncbi:MAG: hypothetical protein HRU28_03410 [Rhizobiales bacterium]|nr:hypothetical protein [Hyphomicrobiales bacterium]
MNNFIQLDDILAVVCDEYNIVSIKACPKRFIANQAIISYLYLAEKYTELPMKIIVARVDRTFPMACWALNGVEMKRKKDSQFDYTLKKLDAHFNWINLTFNKVA